MLCPFCQTENREDRETCYVCGKDISTVRLVVNKARQHYNDALEHAERGRVSEAADELRNAIDLDSSLVNAHVVLGTLLARQGKFPQARESWENALSLNPELSRAHEYLERVENLQLALPTLKTYRWIALALLLTTLSLAVGLIYAVRPDPGLAPLNRANALLENRQYGKAMEELGQAKILANADGPIVTASIALNSALKMDMREQLRMIQDLKYRELYSEAWSAISKLEAEQPDEQTNAALATIREDINYYYHNLVAQLYSAYEQGDVDFNTLHDEISRFIGAYPNSPDRDEISGYLERAETLEVQSNMDELRRRFAQDNNVKTAVEGLRDMAPKFGKMTGFQSERSAFIEEILSYLFNLYTGYLDKNDFERASTLLTDIDRVTTEFRDVVEVDISGAVDLAWSVLRDARRQYQIAQIEKLINNDEAAAAEEGIWEVLQATDLSSTEMDVIRSYWQKLNRRERLDNFLSDTHRDDDSYFNLKVSEQHASETLSLYDDLDDMQLPAEQRLYIMGLAAASSMRLGDNDRATSLAKNLRKMDADSTVTLAARAMIRRPVEKTIKRTRKPKAKKAEAKIVIEPVDTGKPDVDIESKKPKMK